MKKRQQKKSEVVVRKNKRTFKKHIYFRNAVQDIKEIHKIINTNF